MTNLYMEIDGTRVLVTAQGHATGSDNACGGISALLYALAGYAVNRERDGRAEVYQFRADSGVFLLHASGDSGLAEAAEAVLIGLLQIQQAEPDKLTVETPGDDPA